MINDRQRLVEEIGISSYCYDAKYDAAERLIALSINGDEHDDVLLGYSAGLLERIGSFQSLKELKISIAYSEPVFIDLSHLSQLRHLESLEIHNCHLLDLAPIIAFHNLRVLDLSCAEITDITPLRELKQLTHLNLSRNQIVDISALQKLAAIQSLFINSNQLKDLTPISGLTELIELRLDHNHITDIGPLQLLRGLLSLNLSYNPIVDIGPLAPLVHLMHLEIAGIPAIDLQPISAALKLNKLTASDIRFVDGDIVSRFVFLTQLSLIRCNISDLSFIKALINLLQLQLDDNQIQNADVLTSLPKLSLISLRNNRVSEPFSSYPYSSFSLNLEGNPFGKNFNISDDYNFYAASYFFKHNDLDKALAYHYLEVDKRNHIESSGKVALLIYYQKLLNVKPSDSYYRLYYVMRCEQLLKEIGIRDDEVESIRIYLINIVIESDFFNRAELLISLEENGKPVDNYERFAEYLDYLKNTSIPTPNAEIAYFLAKTFMRREDLPQLLSIYRQLLDKKHPFHFTIYRLIKRVLGGRYEFSEYDYYQDMLDNAKDRQIPYFDVYKYLDWAFAGYVHGQPPPRSKPIDWQQQPVENYSGWKVLCWVFAILIVFLIFYKFSVWINNFH